MRNISHSPVSNLKTLFGTTPIQIQPVTVCFCAALLAIFCFVLLTDVNAQKSLFIDLASKKEAVLLPFDNSSIPFRHGLQMDLVSARKYGKVIELGDTGAPDSDWIAYYGTVLQIGDKLHMWYLGAAENKPARVCYATSEDGFIWRRPDLGLVEFEGDSNNNLVQLDFPGSVRTCTVLYDPGDPDPERRFKIYCEVSSQKIREQGCVAFSADGLRWTSSPLNPVTYVRLESTGLVKRDGCYYVIGQNAGKDRGFQKRVLISLASYDFEHWTKASILGFRRDDIPPKPYFIDRGLGNQVHLGAGLWDRGNVIAGFYGQWNAPLHTADRREMRMDIGLLVSHDGLHYQEPIPDFKIIESGNESWNQQNPGGDPPRLGHGQGVVNIGDKSITYYCIWGAGGYESVRAAYWEKDRLGFFSPTFAPTEGQTWTDDVKPHFITAPIGIPAAGARIYINASGISETAGIGVEVLDEQFKQLPGYSDDELVENIEGDMLRSVVQWRQKEIVRNLGGPIRIRVNYFGERLQNLRVYAIYVEGL